MIPLQAARRPLPAGFDVPDDPYSIAPVCRTHYQCVSLPDDAPADPLARHQLTYELAAAWALDDRERRSGIGVIPRLCALCHHAIPRVRAAETCANCERSI